MCDFLQRIHDRNIDSIAAVFDGMTLFGVFLDLSMRYMKR